MLKESVTSFVVFLKQNQPTQSVLVIRLSKSKRNNQINIETNGELINQPPNQPANQQSSYKL